MDADSPPPRDTVEGIDPRALFAWATQRFDIAALLRAWEPPPVEVIAPLFPAYEVVALIGRGGMGAVYRARQANLDREVAIKLMPPEAAADDDFAARFRIEARALAKLHHPNIVAIFEFGQTSDGHLYFVMEYVDGTDLAHLIQAASLRPVQALEIVSRVCDALQFAHQAGVVHRDIKPANVLIAHGGAVKVADFGLAKLHPESTVRSSRQSVPGSVIGTPDYMAPEQLDGREVDARSDIFSLGVMLYEMLTGQLPRGAWEPPSRKVNTDARLDGVVNKALQTEPERRYQQASEVRTAVDGIRSSPIRRRFVPWWLILTLAFPVVLISVVALYRSQTPSPVTSAPLTPAQPEPVNDGSILRALDLRTAIVSGDWRWKENRPGGTLSHAHVAPDQSHRVRLPFRAEGRSYRLGFDLVLLTPTSDAGVVLPVGDTRTGLILNLNGSSGLGMVKQARWDQNETSTPQSLPIGEPISVSVKVGPYYDGATIMVEVNHRALIRWQGKRRDLSLFDDPKLGWTLPLPDELGFVTYGGAVEFSNVEVVPLSDR